MKNKQDLTGLTFGRIYVIGFAYRKDSNYYWECSCSCGATRFFMARSQIIGNKFPSCGCLYSEALKKYNIYSLSGDFGIGYIGDREFYFDLEDYEKIKDVCWSNKEGYVSGRLNKRIVSIHRLIMNFPDKRIIDHIDGNPYNNRKSNLRVVTQRENMQNIRKPNKKTSSKYIGVYMSKEGKWTASIKGKGKILYLGSFLAEVDAAKAYNKKAEELGYLTRNII